jgi:creatinine amidohydrolase
MRGERLKYRYDHYTWPEMRDLVMRQPVVIQPIGSVEDHGYHLPLDVDNFLITSICEEVGRRIPDEVLVLPNIPYGFEDHHMSFPGTITVGIEHLLHFVTDVGTSVARHGFQKIVFADGHGSNMPILDLAARRVVVQTDALCSTFIWPSLILSQIREHRNSEYPGGTSHAGELETSVYMHLNRQAVQLELAQRDVNFHKSKYYWHDLGGGGPVRFMDWWSRISKTGVIGDPTVATAEKGKIWFDAAVENFIEFVREFRGFEVRDKLDHHGDGR